MDSDSEVKRTLDLRLARGEITQEEYNEILGVIKKSDSPPQSTDAVEEPLQSVAIPPAAPLSAAAVSAPQHPQNVQVSAARAHEVSVGVQTAVASTQSFVGSAVLTWVLYYVGFYIIGFIVNLVYLSSAKNIFRQTGISPSGRGCLQFLFFVHFWLPIVALLLLIVAGLGVGFESSGLMREFERFFKDLFSAI
jgi:hypothetical protein